MFQDDDLKNHLETASVVRVQSAVIAEWNMNIADNILQIGNYRNRPSSATSRYRTINNTFDLTDYGDFYTGATDADIVVDGGVDDNDEPLLFTSFRDKEKLLYSLEDCFGKFRPRSGINKLRYFPTNFSHHSNPNLARRPRYYMASKDDQFKYWTSYRFENNTERGISSRPLNGQNYIEDAAPYIVYKNELPANRIVVKMQTSVGDIDLGPFTNKAGSFSDPFFGTANQTTPTKWKIQYLRNNTWIDAVSFNSGTTRRDGTPVIKSDGYVELAYGLIVPDKYRDVFIRAEEYASTSWLPEQSINGYAYLIRENEADIGTYHIWFNNEYQEFTPTYGWYLEEETVDRLTNFVTDLTNPIKYVSTTDNSEQYREFQFIEGLRIVVDTMNKPDATFDLIELSPRLTVDLSDKTKDFSLKKTASDLGISGMPVGQLLAASGSISIFDYDQAFNSNNTGSIIHKYLTKNIQFKFYEITVNVNGYDYFVPIKTMYSEGFPKYDLADRNVEVQLRDMFFYLESLAAPQLLIQNASLSYAISLLLDSVGFSNYTFKRNVGEPEATIPYFFVAPDTSIAQVLNDLAISTQTAMFFDEYNNFVAMSKNYIMPSLEDRDTDLVLYGSSDQQEVGGIKNQTTKSKIANVVDIASQNNEVYNGGTISYTTRYIQRSYGSLRQAGLLDMDKTWIYKPALLWEVTGTENLRSVNDQAGTMSNYVLGAIPLNSSLTQSVPEVVNHRVVNNVMDLGEGIYWITRYNGYFYANGEVIKYDAVQYNVPQLGQVDGTTVEVASNNVWISSVQEYQNYFSKLSFNGKIYPTGLVRIYSEPEYETVNDVLRLKNGAVAKHGRGQFGTPVVRHEAGLSPYWSDIQNVRGCEMKSKYLFGSSDTVVLPNASSSSNVITVRDTSLVKVGHVVSITTSDTTGILGGIATVTAVLTDKTFRISRTPQVALDKAIISLEFPAYTAIGPAGVNNSVAQKSTRNGVIKNFLSALSVRESEASSYTTAKPGTVQSSALVVNGPSFDTTQKPIDFVTYIKKPLTDKFKHFGTRMRIVGKIESGGGRSQSPVGSTPYFNLTGATPDKNVSVSGSSGGIAVLLNPETNNGYFFELVALTENNINSYSGSSTIHNLMFYKVMKDSVDSTAVPVKLWSGIGNIIVDDGRFTGQSRIVGEENPTVYDVAVEYQDLGSLRKFYLYVNNKLVAEVNDEAPLPVYNNMALFVRGSSRIMFENIYAVTNNYSQNTTYALDTPVNSIFGDSEIDSNESFRKYAMSGIIQSTYLSGISPMQPPEYRMYFEEFGTIMREAAYFNVKYDKAYPALYAKLSPTFNKIRGYSVAGFMAGAYGAEFLVFNATDSALNLDETSGNYLRIQGITFTQESRQELTVDDYFSKRSDFSNPQFAGDTLISSPLKVKKDYSDIKTSRMTHGRKDFSLEAPYIQTQDDANNLMGWMISKVMKPRRSVGIKIFAMPIIQLGDIVQIDYKDSDGIDIIAPYDTRFVVYDIDYSRSSGGPEMTLYLSEVA
jgi:hypothetical protein